MAYQKTEKKDLSSIVSIFYQNHRFSHLAKAIYTTHLLIVGRLQGGNGLKLQSSVKLDLHNLGLHCFREDIANKHSTAVLKNIVAYVSYPLTGIVTFGKLHTLQAFRKSYSSLLNSASDINVVLS